MTKYKIYFKKNLLMMLLLVFVILIGLLFINFFSQNNFENNSLGGSFSLTDQNGNNFDSSKLKKKKLIYFGYTFCPDVCPFDLLKISKVFQLNSHLKEKIKPIFITVDPKRDTIEQLKIFMENFDKSILGLTGSREEIKKVIKNFRIYVKMNKKGPEDENYLIDHSSLIFLLDENDNFLKFFRPKDFSLNSID